MIFNRRKKAVDGFHANMPLDTKDVKIVNATLDGKQVFWAAGLSAKSRRELEAKGGFSLPPTISAEALSKSNKEWEWIAFVNPDNMPGFIPREMVRPTMAGTITTVSGFTTYGPDIKVEDATSDLAKAIEAYAKAVRQRTR